MSSQLVRFWVNPNKPRGKRILDNLDREENQSEAIRVALDEHYSVPGGEITMRMLLQELQETQRQLRELKEHRFVTTEATEVQQKVKGDSWDNHPGPKANLAALARRGGG